MSNYGCVFIVTALCLCWTVATFPSSCTFSIFTSSYCIPTFLPSHFLSPCSSLSEFFWPVLYSHLKDFWRLTVVMKCRRVTLFIIIPIEVFTEFLILLNNFILLPILLTVCTQCWYIKSQWTHTNIFVKIFWFWVCFILLFLWHVAETGYIDK